MNRNKFFAAFAELQSRGAIEVGEDERGSYVRWVGGTAGAAH